MISECPLAFYQSAGYVLFAFQLTARAKVGAKRFASIVMGRTHNMATSHVEHWDSADQKPNARLECKAPAIAIGEIGNTEIWDRKIGDPFKLHWKLLYNKSLRYPQISFPMFPGVILNVLQETTHGPPPDRIFQFRKIYVWVPQKTPMSHGTCPLKIPSKSHRLMMADAYHVLMLFKDIMISDPMIFQMKKTWRTSGGSQ